MLDIGHIGANKNDGINNEMNDALERVDKYGGHSPEMNTWISLFQLVNQRDSTTMETLRCEGMLKITNGGFSVITRNGNVAINVSRFVWGDSIWTSTSMAPSSGGNVNFVFQLVTMVSNRG